MFNKKPGSRWGWHGAVAAGLGMTFACLQSAPAQAELPDLERWSCRYCAPPTLNRGLLELGTTHSDAALYHPRGNLDHDQPGLSLLANGYWLTRDEQGHHFSVSGAELGLDSRRLALRTGATGRLRLSLDYRGIPLLLSDTARTPFREAQGSQLQLPTDWQRAGSTRGMNQLQTSAQALELRRDRQDWRAALRLTPGHHWDLDLKLRHQQVDGRSSTAGSFVTKASLLPQVIDWTTSELELTAGYSAQRWQTQLGYLVTQFRNQSQGLSWDNPYNPVVEGADRGRLAPAPNNSWQRIAWTHRWQALRTLGLNLHLIAGQATQDQSFVPATENPNIQVQQSRDSLQGRLNMRSGKLGVVYRPGRRLRLRARYWLDDRDNRTPIAIWQPVMTDVEELEPRPNRPYSFRREQGRLSLRLRPHGPWQMLLGAQSETRERDLQQFEVTRTDSVWAELGRRRTGGSSLSLRISGSQRDGEASAGDAGADMPAPENPRMRQFHLADREQRKLSLRWHGQPAAEWTLNLQFSRASNDYRNSPIGLQSSAQWGASVSLAWTPSQAGLSLSGFLSAQRIEAELLNSASFSFPDWMGESRDNLLAHGLSLRLPNLVGRTSLALDYQLSYSRGDMRVDADNPNPAFPSLRARMHSLKLALEYPVRAGLTLRGGYQLERYSGDDWGRDQIDIDTISHVLSLAEAAGDRHLNLLSLSLQYEF